MLLNRRAARVIALVGCCLGAGAWSAAQEAKGGKAAAFSAKTMNGGQVKLPESYKGKLVLLDFWATWCAPCKAEIPHLVAAYKKHKGPNFEILGVTLDESQKVSAEKVRDFMKKNEMTWEVVYEGCGAIQEKYDVRRIPSAFLIDGDTGEIVASGAKLRGAQLGKTIEDALAAKAKKK